MILVPLRLVPLSLVPLSLIPLRLVPLSLRLPIPVMPIIGMFHHYCRCRRRSLLTTHRPHQHHPAHHLSSQHLHSHHRLSF
jgi:hypothetical protein